MKKFEYKIENLKAYGVTSLVLTKDHENKLNKLGEEGWELIELNTLKNPRNITAVFKRVISE